MRIYITHVGLKLRKRDACLFLEKVMENKENTF